MPTLNLTDEQAAMIVNALKQHRWYLMSEWSKTRVDEDMAPFVRDIECKRIDADIVKIGLFRQQVEATIDTQRGIRSRAEVEAEFSRRIMNPVDEVRAFMDAVKMGWGRGDVAKAMGEDIEQIDADNARDVEKITEAEANRRRAVAEMLIAELDAAEAMANLPPTAHPKPYPGRHQPSWKEVLGQCR